MTDQHGFRAPTPQEQLLLERLGSPLSAQQHQRPGQSPEQPALSESEQELDKTQRDHRATYLIGGAVVLVLASSLYLGHGDSEPAESTPAAKQPVATSATPSEAAITAAAPSETAIAPANPVANDPKTFQPTPVGCLPSSTVTVGAHGPIVWYKGLESTGRLYSTPRGDYDATMAGTTAVMGCYNDLTGVTYDQAASDQSGIATYSVDASKAMLNVNTDQTKTTITAYSEDAVFTSLQKSFGAEAKPVDARRLLAMISRDSTDIDAIMRLAMERKLLSPNRLKLLGAQAMDSVLTNLQSQAVTCQKISADSIRFVVTDGVSRKSLPFLSKDKPVTTTADFKFFKQAANYEYNIQATSAGANACQ